MSYKVAFIGLGVMGYPMAGHLVKAGHHVTVYNRTLKKAEQWVAEFGGGFAATPKEASIDCDIVFSCVGNDNDVRAIAYGNEGVLAGLNAGGIFVDHTTASAHLAKELATACASKNIAFMDAPVSGGQAGAENGVLTIMVGGEQTTFNKVSSVLSAYAKFSQLMGVVGNGQLAKMVNQICIAGVVQGLAEGLNFAQKVGLNGDDLINAIGKGAAGSWQMENRYKTMLDNKFDFGFAVDWMRKDLGIVFDQAKKCGAQLPMTHMVDEFYSEIQANGGNRWDTSSLITRLKDQNR